MEFTAKNIAEFVGGRIEGDENAAVSTFAKIEEGTKGALSFLYDGKFAHFLYETAASVVLVSDDIELTKPVSATIIRVKNAREAVARLMQLYENLHAKKTGIDPAAHIASTANIGEESYVGAMAYIGDGAVIGKGCQIYPLAYIGDNVRLGDGCTVYPNAVVYHDCIIGNRVILHAGSIIGADGFGFQPTAEGYEKIPQIGIVTIEDDVEIGANTCIDRSTMGSTYVRKGVKLDNLVQIAHNTDIGRHTVMSAQVGVAGSTKVGEWCVCAGQVGISGHITVGDRVTFGAKTGVHSSVGSNKELIGIPPQPQFAYFKMLALMRRLPELNKQVADLERQVAELEKKIKP